MPPWLRAPHPAMDRRVWGANAHATAESDRPTRVPCTRRNVTKRNAGGVTRSDDSRTRLALRGFFFLALFSFPISAMRFFFFFLLCCTPLLLLRRRGRIRGVVLRFRNKCLKLFVGFDKGVFFFPKKLPLKLLHRSSLPCSFAEEMV